MRKYKWVQRAICFIIGHDVEWVIEHRLRNGHISLNRKGGKKRNQSRWVPVEAEDWVLLPITTSHGVYPTYHVVVDELFRKMFVEPTANNEEREMCIADALQICDGGIPIRRKSWGANEDGFNAFVMLLNVHVASHLPKRFRAAVQFDGRSREITTEKQYLLVTPRFINDLDINWHATPYVPTWRDIRANDWVVAYKKKD